MTSIPTDPAARLSTSAVTVDRTSDRRVGANLGLGGADPALLPAKQRGQAEPHLARSPLDPDLLVAAFQEGRFAGPGALTCGYAVSRDGGLTWSRDFFPKLTRLSGGPYYRATDPVVAIDHRETIYLCALGATDNNFDSGVVAVCVSTNRGASFSAPIEAFRPSSTSVFPDKTWMAVNSFAGTPHEGRVLITFTRIDGVSEVVACVHSDDQGRTWSKPVGVGPQVGFTQGAQPVFLPDGRLVVVYWNFGAGTVDLSDDRLEAVVSSDGGETFGTPVVIAPVRVWDDPGMRDGWFLPSAVADRNRGVIHLVWQGREVPSGAKAGAPRVFYSQSADAGGSWTAPVAVNDTPGGKSVFNPAVAVSPAGDQVVVTFLDMRQGNVATNHYNDFDLYSAASGDGGRTWSSNVRLSDATSDGQVAPLTGLGYMVGDYMGLVAPQGRDIPAVAFWVDTRSGDPDPVLVRFSTTGPLTYEAWRSVRFSHSVLASGTGFGRGDDFDRDGVPNLVEYALGMDPGAPDRIPVQWSLLGSTSAEGWRVQYPAFRDMSDVVLGWEVSDDLIHWSRSEPSQSVDLAGGVASGVMREARFVPEAGRSRFWRLAVLAP